MDTLTTHLLTAFGVTPPSRMPPVVMVRPAHPGAPPAGALEQAVLRQMRERHSETMAFEKDWRTQCERDTRYAKGEQWDQAVAQHRQNDPGGPRVMITMNRFPTFLNYIQNEQRQNRQGGIVAPVGEGADQATALVMQEMIRHIEQASRADEVLDTAFQTMAQGGKGFIRLVTEYETPWQFEQVLRLKRVANPLSVVLDHTARTDLDYHTAAYGFVVERRKKAQVREEYEIDQSTWQQWLLAGEGWVASEECLIADYYYREDLAVTLVDLGGGVVRYVPMLTETEDEAERQRQEDLVQVAAGRLARYGVLPLQAGEEGALQAGARTRQSRIPIIRWCKTNGHRMLEQTIWPGEAIPIIPVLGTEYEVDGTTDYQGLVRQGIGIQDKINYVESLAVATAALAPRQPYKAVEGTLDGYEHQWGTLNTTNWAYLYYRQNDRMGQPAPPPQRDVTEPAIQAVTLLAQQAGQQLYDVLGIYPPSLGQPSNETSGTAISRRQSATALGTAHYQMNLARAIRWYTQQIVDMLPFVYVEPNRVVTIVRANGEEGMVQLQPGRGAPLTQSGPAEALPSGIAGIYDLTTGRYGVRVKAGPSQESRQEETLTHLTELTQVAPIIGQTRPDLLVETLNFAKADELARSLRRRPEVAPFLDPQDATKPEEQVVILQGQIQQMQAQMEQLGQQLQLLNSYAQQREAESAQLTQDNETLKLQLHDKQAEQAQAQAELAAQRDLDLRKLSLEEQKLAFEREKFYHTAAQAEAEQVADRVERAVERVTQPEENTDG